MHSGSTEDNLRHWPWRLKSSLSETVMNRYRGQGIRSGHRVTMTVGHKSLSVNDHKTSANMKDDNFLPPADWLIMMVWRYQNRQTESLVARQKMWVINQKGLETGVQKWKTIYKRSLWKYLIFGSLGAIKSVTYFSSSVVLEPPTPHKICAWEWRQF
jgi:hypothetical protein